MAVAMTDSSHYQGPAFFSYGFRPFFLGAAIFSGVAIPAWVLILAGAGESVFLYPPRDWHVHEMVFGFLPAVITGFLLTAIPNWTERPPVMGMPLMVLLTLWLAGRLFMSTPWFTPFVSALVDGAFLIVVAGILWREIVAGGAWDRVPIGVLISLYAFTNILFHVLFLRGLGTDLPERMALALVMVLLTLIGGRITPNFTQDYFAQQGMTEQPAPFSPVDGVSIILVGIAAVVWTIQPEALVTGWMLVAAGLANFVRVLRWHGWVTWREPLVLILHLGYGWLVISLLVLGGGILGLGIQTVDALHALTTGAVGVMTLAVMTRASLGHTGRPRHAGPMTVLIYILVNLGAILRLFVSITDISINTILGLSAVCWSGAYLLFALVYGPMLLRPGTDGQ